LLALALALALRWRFAIGRDDAVDATGPLAGLTFSFVHLLFGGSVGLCLSRHLGLAVTPSVPQGHWWGLTFSFVIWWRRQTDR
jgi:hypothetical protein